MVGSRIVELLNPDFQFIPLYQSKMDITEKPQVQKKLSNLDFDIFLHLAAYTNVAGAEQHKELAYKINRDGTRNIFEIVDNKKKKFIYVSSDFIFDGKNPPYFEDSKPNPQDVYASSKYAGEKIVKDRAMIIRIAYPYRADFASKKDFFRTFKSLLEQNKRLVAINDSLLTPTFIDDIAYCLKYLINNFSPEIFHLVGSAPLSPYRAAIQIADKFSLDKSLIGKTTHAEYVKLKPGLPKLSDIRSKKNNFYKMKSFKEGLSEIAKQLQNF